MQEKTLLKQANSTSNADTELYDYGFRDYSPTIARFTSVDPIRDGRNWYCYVVNDPVNYVDLWGLCGSDGNHWIDNGDGTFTALEGATLWGLYGADWQEKSGFEGDPTTLQVGDTVGKKVPRPTFQYPNSILERKEALLSPETEIDVDNETIPPRKTNQSNKVIRKYGIGGKFALIFGLGAELGYITDGNTRGIYITGSYGCGIQVATGNYSSVEELFRSFGNIQNSISVSLGIGNIQPGTTTSETVDIGIGVIGTWDLNELNSSGMPNEFSFGNVGGGYWYNSTSIFTF